MLHINLMNFSQRFNLYLDINAVNIHRLRCSITLQKKIFLLLFLLRCIVAWYHLDQTEKFL